MMMEERRGSSLFFSFLFALVGVVCIGVSIWLMPWTSFIQAAEADEGPDLGSKENKVFVETIGNAPQKSSLEADIDVNKPADPALSPPLPDPEDASLGKAEAPVVEGAATDVEAEQPAKREAQALSGPWTITLVPNNYAITTKGWETIKEIRALLISNNSVRIGIAGTANIMRSKKRASQAAKIVRDRISQGDPRLTSRMSISGNLSEKEHGLSVGAKVLGGTR
jgi:hypothetical protein